VPAEVPDQGGSQLTVGATADWPGSLTVVGRRILPRLGTRHPSLVRCAGKRVLRLGLEMQLNTGLHATPQKGRAQLGRAHADSHRATAFLDLRMVPAYTAPFRTIINFHAGHVDLGFYDRVCRANAVPDGTEHALRNG